MVVMRACQGCTNGSMQLYTLHIKNLLPGTTYSNEHDVSVRRQPCWQAHMPPPDRLKVRPRLAWRLRAGPGVAWRQRTPPGVAWRQRSTRWPARKRPRQTCPRVHNLKSPRGPARGHGRTRTSPLQMQASAAPPPQLNFFCPPLKTSEQSFWDLVKKCRIHVQKTSL